MWSRRTFHAQADFLQAQLAHLLAQAEVDQIIGRTPEEQECLLPNPIRLLAVITSKAFDVSDVISAKKAHSGMRLKDRRKEK